MKPFSSGEIAILVVLVGVLILCVSRLFSGSGGGKSTTPALVSSTVTRGGGTSRFIGAIAILAIVGIIVFSMAFGTASPAGQVTLATAVQGTVTAIWNGFIVFTFAGLAVIAVAIFLAVKRKGG